MNKSGSGSRQYRVSGGRRRILCVRGSKNGPRNLTREEPALWRSEGEHSRQTWGAGHTRPVQWGNVERVEECEPRAQRQSGPFLVSYYRRLYFPGGSDGKASAYKAGDLSSIPGWERSSGEGNGNPLQYACLEKPMDGGACAAVHGSQSVVHDCATSLHFTRSLDCFEMK